MYHDMVVYRYIVTSLHCRIMYDGLAIQLTLCRYCITGLMYHDMVVYRYIVVSLHYSIMYDGLAIQ